MNSVNLRVYGNEDQGQRPTGDLRPYQREAVAALTALRSDRKHLHVVSLPTGSGKMRVLLALLARLLTSDPAAQILLLAPRWPLLNQILEETHIADPSLAGQVARIGGQRKCPGALREMADASIFLTTPHTWHRRHMAGTLPAGLNDGELVVIIDESHWAMEARFGKLLRSTYLEKALMFGFSATPNIRPGGTYRVAYHKTYAELCPAYLARPLVREVHTGLEWEPALVNGILSPRSLAQLGRREVRNRVVVDECLAGFRERRYTRVVVFACNIAHANTLQQDLFQCGVCARAYHSQQSDAENQEALNQFRSGAANVLVTVQMASLGLNIPEIDAVFLTRPTESLTLLAQMIGRGSRKLPDKDSFWIVEFTDNVRRFAARIFHARDYLGDAAVVVPGRRQYHAVTQHHEPRKAPRFENLELPGLPRLTFAPDQTFGVELELTSREGVPNSESPMWTSLATEIVASIEAVASAPVHPRPVEYHQYEGATKWYVTSDASAGWEVISPILVNEAGFEELMRVCEAVRTLVAEHHSLCVNHHTGLHITLATCLHTSHRRRRLVELITRLEPGLFTLVAPSRLYAFDGCEYHNRDRNWYCAPLREALRDITPMGIDAWSCWWDRYRSVNVTKLEDPCQLLEVRMHQGTVDFQKIVAWICLWMQITHRTRFPCHGGAEAGKVFRSGNRRITQRFADREDILKRLTTEGITLNPEFQQFLRQRRAELRPFWKKVLPQRVAGWERAGWYDRPDPEPVVLPRELVASPDAVGLPQTA